MSSNLSLTTTMLSLSFILSYFYFSISVDMLWEFCFIRNSADLDSSFRMLLRSLAVVMIPIVSLRDPSSTNVVPYLFYKSNEMPAILHSWKNVEVCF